MEKGRLFSRGRLVIPAKIREKRNIKTGMEFYFIEKGTDIILRPVTDDLIDSMRGMLKGKALTALIKEKKKERE